MGAFSLTKSNALADYPTQVLLASRSRDPDFELECACGDAPARTDQPRGAVAFPRAVTSSVLKRSA
jgi:hypothetical protein